MKETDKFNPVLRQFYSKSVICNLDTKICLIPLDFSYTLQIGQGFRCSNQLYKLEELRLYLCFMANSIKILAEFLPIEYFHGSIRQLRQYL